MPNSNSSPKRRPVDLLFGEELETRPSVQTSPPPTPAPQSAGNAAEATPNYMVERPRPATVLRPPPPEFPADWRAHTQAETAVERSISVFPPPVNNSQMQPGLEAASAVPKPADVISAAHTGIERSQTQVVPPVLTPPPEQALSPSAAAIPPQELGAEEYDSLASLIDVLYQRVSEEASDSPLMSEQCLMLLHEARAALEHNDYAQAEYKAEQVKARLLRARASLAAAASTTIKLIWGWQILTGLLSVGAILLPFFIALPPGVVPLLRAVSFGVLGGIMVSVWNLTHYFHSREYDTAYNSDYWVGPIKGGLIGGFIFFLSALGLVAAPGALGGTRVFGSLSGANLLMYFLALLAGIGQDYVFEFVRRVLAAVFRSPSRGRLASTRGSIQT